MGALPPVFIEFLGKATGFYTTSKGVRTELAAVQREGGGNLAKLGAVSKAALLGIGVAAAAAAVHTVHMAADFETAMTRVRTGAGESQANMAMVGRGVLQMAGEVGQSTEQLTGGLYKVESAGFHGADALTILKTSAQGAKVGAADLVTVADAVTTAMKDYSLQSSDATKVMNSLIATEANGKTTLEALAGSLATVSPIAATAHVGLNEVLGAMSTMTSLGTDAASAATYLKQTIGMLAKPTGSAAQEMKSLGLDSVEVSKNLGTNGLASTLTMLTDAIQSKMGPAGTVLIEHLQKASANTTEFQKVLANIPPAQQTYVGALASMVGGTKSMQAALELTGPHMQGFRDNVAKIDAQVKAGGNSVEGWKEVQGTFNQKMAEAKGALQAIGIEIGQKLMPVATRLLEWFAASVHWMTQHQSAVIALGSAIGGILVFGLAAATVAAWNFAAGITAATWELVLIVAAVMIVVGAIVYLVMHWRDIWKWIKEVTKEAVDWLIGAWHTLASATSKAWNDWIVQPILDAWHALASFFSSAWHAVADPLVAAWHWIANITSAVWGAISAFFARWWPLLLVIFATPIALVMAAWNHFHEAAFSIARTVWGAISGFFVGIWNWIVGVAQGAWLLFYQYIVQPNVDLFNFLSGIWNSVVSWLGGVWDSIGSGASSGWRMIRTYILHPLEEIWNDITGIFGKIGGFVWDALMSGLHAIERVGEWYMDIGTQIVMGIVHGIEHAAGWLFDSLKNLASDALDSAKSFLGINSPSRLFADHVGSAIPEGIAKGVDDNAHLAHSAVTRLAGGTVGAFGKLGSVEPAFAGGRGFTSGGGQVVHQTHVHVTVQGSVVAERDLANTVQKVMLQTGARNSGTYQPYRI